MTDRLRILVFHENSEIGDSLCGRLAHEGFEAISVETFLDAAPFLVAGRVNLFLISLPETEWIRNTILTEVSRANSMLPIVAVTETISDDLGQVLERLHVTTLLPAGCSWVRLMEAIHNALGSLEPTGGQS